MKHLVCALFLALSGVLSAPAGAEDVSGEALAAQAFELFQGSRVQRQAALDALAQSGRRDAVPILVMALRYTTGTTAPIVSALERLSGANPGSGWDDWMKWQESHPETGTIPGFGKLQARVFQLIDPQFKLFLSGSEHHDIRFEEIVWGGVVKDGIPALTNPRLIAANYAGYLNDSDLVFGVSINDDIRAYPLRIMDWHEMFNDVIGGVPVSLAYCTLCGSGILFESQVEGRSTPFTFGSSGFLYRSNKLMYDTETNSLWNQFTGRPVVGALTGSGIELKTRPVVISSWADWKARHPRTRVLTPDTGFKRDYSAGAAYGDYFSSPGLMFPTNTAGLPLQPKDYVFALRSSVVEKAWPLALFDGGAVINDQAGILALVLIGDQATRTVRAYRSDGLAFQKREDRDQLNQDGATWTITEDALVGPNGRTLPRLPGHIAYAFAWNGYYGAQGQLAAPK